MKYYVLLTLCVLFWSGNFVFGRMISEQINPIELSFYRWFFVLVLFLPYIFINFKRLYEAFKKNKLLLSVFGILGVSGFNTFVYLGLQSTSATNALLINSSTPILIILLSVLIFRTLITKVQLLGVFLSTIGVLYLVLKGSFENIITLEFSQGDLWIIFACFIWALYSVFLKFKPKDLNALDFFSITMIIGTLILYVVFKYFAYSISLDFVKNDEVLYCLAYMVIFPSILSFYFWNISTVELGANKAGQFTHLMPIFGSILAYIFLKESLQFYHFVGIVLIGSGIYLSMFYKRKIS